MSFEDLTELERRVIIGFRKQSLINPEMPEIMFSILKIKDFDAKQNRRGIILRQYNRTERNVKHE